jgi:hypothetical protein
MPFISENRLEAALVKAVKTPSAAQDFYRLLLESDLMVLGTIQGRETSQGQRTLELGAKLDLVFGRHQEQEFLPVFSSLPRMQAYVTKDSPCITLKGRDLLDMTRGMPVILNPNSEYGKKLTADEIAQLLDSAGPQLTSPPRPIPDDYPMDLVEMLRMLFAARPEISRAWMVRITPSGQAENHPLVGVETSGDMAALMADIERAALAAVPGLIFDVQRVDRDNPIGMAGALLQAPPFYERNPTGFTLN